MFMTKKVVFQRISKPIAWFDRHVIDAFMNLLSTVTNLVSTGIKRIQSGELQDYAWAFYMGAMVIVALVVFL